MWVNFSNEITQLKNLNQNLPAIWNLSLCDNFSFDVTILMINHETTANDWIAKQIGSPFLCERDGTTAVAHFSFLLPFCTKPTFILLFCVNNFCPRAGTKAYQNKCMYDTTVWKNRVGLLRNPTTEKCRPYLHSAQWFKGL